MNNSGDHTETGAGNFGDQTPAEPSKTQRKRQHHAIQNFVRELIELLVKELNQPPLPEQITTEVVSARKLSRSALKRQISFIAKIIAKLMDTAETEIARAALEKLHQTNAKTTKIFHQYESWRDRLLDPGNPHKDTLIAELVGQHGADRQRLRQLIRGAEKETKSNQAPKSARQLFQYLKKL